MELGEKLKYFRESKKMSIYRLALEADISQGHLSDLENGRSQPTISTLKRLLVPLGITLAEFFNEDNEISILTEKEKELVALYRTMPNDRAKVFIQLGNFLNHP